MLICFNIGTHTSRQSIRWSFFSFPREDMKYWFSPFYSSNFFFALQFFISKINLNQHTHTHTAHKYVIVPDVLRTPSNISILSIHKLWMEHVRIPTEPFSTTNIFNSSSLLISHRLLITMSFILYIKLRTAHIISFHHSDPCFNNTNYYYYHLCCHYVGPRSIQLNWQNERRKACRKKRKSDDTTNHTKCSTFTFIFKWKMSLNERWDRDKRF